MSRIFISLFILVLLSSCVFAQVTSDTAIMNQVNEKLDKNKAEIIKAIRDTQAQNQNATSTFIDQNFANLDTRIQGFFKDNKRDFAIIIIAGFLVAFALSQVIRISIEKSRRKSLIQRAMELEATVEKLSKEAIDITTKVRQLKALDSQYSAELKGYMQKEPFISLRMAMFGIITLLLGVLFTYFVMGGKF